MIVYEFNISSLTKKTINSIDDVIISVVWEKVGHDGDGNSGSYKLSTTLDTSAVESDTNFTNYDDLQKQDVVNWIKSIINEDDVNEIILENIQKSKDNQTTINKDQLHWTLKL